MKIHYDSPAPSKQMVISVAQYNQVVTGLRMQLELQRNMTREKIEFLSEAYKALERKDAELQEYVIRHSNDVKNFEVRLVEQASKIGKLEARLRKISRNKKK